MTQEQIIRLFLRLLSLIYFVAFASLCFQLHGLAGSQGIQPVAGLLQTISTKFTVPSRYWVFPTLCWINAGDLSLTLQMAAGLVCSAIAALRCCQKLMFLSCWILYLSLSIAGQTFLSFQWDALLLETGLIAVMLAPLCKSGRSEAPDVPLLLLRWLLFRLMFGSGLVKLLSGDPSWSNLTALDFHYQTQPLPNTVAYLVHRAPPAFHKFSCFCMFVIELALPLLIFGPQLSRRIAGTVLILFQVLIILTGNYAFFNLLSITLCLPLFIPVGQPGSPPVRQRAARLLRQITASPLALLIIYVSCIQQINLVAPDLIPEKLVTVSRWFEPFRSINRYGLFAVMTTDRLEIAIEGSDDMQTWETYSFKWKAGDTHRRPAQVAPHQPRLDWQMWFAALGPVDQSPWLLNLMYRMLEGAPPVLALLDHNPFPDHPPKYIRALIYRYNFSSYFELQTQGRWWNRELLGFYVPAITLERPKDALPEEPATAAES